VKKQWHPLFARLLRPLVEAYYEVRTNVAVGEAPREADIVLLQRTSTEQPHFTGHWRYLTVWNVLEYKGPTVAPRSGHLERLIELGLGIHRRLNEERAAQEQPLVPRAEVSFWYLANRIGRRFFADARAALGPLTEEGLGLWRCTLLRHPIFLVNSSRLPVQEDSLPLHLLGPGPVGAERQLIDLIAQRPTLWDEYSGWLGITHPDLWEEVLAMSKTKSRGFRLDLTPAIESLGIKEVVRQIGLDRVIAAIGPERVMAEVVRTQGTRAILETLTPAQRRELKELLK
jgi:hypothetical protein